MWTFLPSVRYFYLFVKNTNSLTNTKSSCLRSWLEQHNNCPTCRFSLILNQPSSIPSSSRSTQSTRSVDPIPNHPFTNPSNFHDRNAMDHIHGDGGMGIGALNQNFAFPAEHVYNFGNKRTT